MRLDANLFVSRDLTLNFRLSGRTPDHPPERWHCLSKVRENHCRYP